MIKKSQVEVCACMSLAEMEAPSRIGELTVSRQFFMTTAASKGIVGRERVLQLTPTSEISCELLLEHITLPV